MMSPEDHRIIEEMTNRMVCPCCLKVTALGNSWFQFKSRVHSFCHNCFLELENWWRDKVHHGATAFILSSEYKHFMRVLDWYETKVEE